MALMVYELQPFALRYGIYHDDSHSLKCHSDGQHTAITLAAESVSAHLHTGGNGFGNLFGEIKMCRYISARGTLENHFFDPESLTADRSRDFRMERRTFRHRSRDVFQSFSCVTGIRHHGGFLSDGHGKLLLPLLIELINVPHEVVMIGGSWLETECAIISLACIGGLYVEGLSKAIDGE